MLMLGPIGFSSPWILAALVALPVIWLLLRAVPPAPVTRVFPGVSLLLGLEDRKAEADRTPWWLLALRLLAVAALIIGFAGPVLNSEPTEPGRGPLLIIVDDGWAAAPDWRARMAALRDRLGGAAASGRTVAVVTPSSPPEIGRLPMVSAGEAMASVAGLAPQPWPVDHAGLLAWLATVDAPEDALWISDGLDTGTRTDLARRLAAAGQLEVLQPPSPRLGLTPARIEDGLVHITALRSTSAGEQEAGVTAYGPDPAGVERALAEIALRFEDGASHAEARLSLPPELRNRIMRFEITGQRAAGAVTLADDNLKRRKVALIGPSGREALDLLSPLHYLREALAPSAEVIEGVLSDLLNASPDVIVLADVAALAGPDAEALEAWVAEGGLLLRFAGPRLAASDMGRGVDDPLLPVRLRSGGRNVGGAMSWGEPRAVAPFPEGSPFYGLPVPDEVRVSAQVLAEPGPTLSERTIAALADGTPLVTRKTLGDGQVVLFHVSADAEWSTLPISGLFVQMLERLAVSTGGAASERGALDGTTWVAETLLDGFGALEPAGDHAGVAGAELLAPVGPALPPGLYASDNRRLAVNVLPQGATLEPASWPAGIAPQWQEDRVARDLAAPLLVAAALLLLIDVIASLALSGRLSHGARLAGLGLALFLVLPPDSGLAQTDPRLAQAAGEVTLAYVLTGDSTIDRVSDAGLTGLSEQLFARSSVEPAAPVGVDLETDELAVYPLLYWPVIEAQPLPSPEAYRRLNAYLRAGGMILFDTRDGDLAGVGTSATPETARLRVLARPLDIPPLEPVPSDHVLTRAFYLLSDFPGRFAGQPVWVEAAPAAAEASEGMPFRNLTDGVTPVVIGGNDWASAWAVDSTGAPMFPVGRGFAGERQREMAYRFGINLVMHVLTGNYKSDQVHVPALLERLGQ